MLVLISEVMDDFNNIWQDEMSVEVWDKLERVFDYSIAFLWVA